jgi:hypothetical protein
MSDKLTRVVFPYLKDIDLLVLAGDMTDTELSLASLEAQHVIEFFIRLYQECEKNDVDICLLRGTVSHDRDHLRILKSLHATYKFKNKLHYHETIGLTEITHLGLKIGFLPDNLPYKTSNEAIAVLKELMHKKGWDMLDYVVFHGYAKHVLPTGMDHADTIFDIEQFDFVKRAVMAGHVHTPSLKSHRFSNDHELHFFYNSSFERLAHGEEEDKGFMLVTEDGDDTEFKFVKNPYATGFFTFDLYAYDKSEDIFRIFEEKMSKINTSLPVHVRVLHPQSEIRSSLARHVLKTYPHVKFTSKSKKIKKRDIEDTSHPSSDTFKTLIAPSKDTLPIMIHDFLKDKNITLDITEIESMLRDT